MSIVSTDLRQTRQSAREISYSPAAPITAYTVQNAIEQVQAEIAAGSVKPPAIVPTAVTFAMSPYTVLATDYLLDVDTSGGAITINMMAAAVRNNLEITIKDSTGHASTPANNISVVANGAETSDGLATYPIASDFGAYKFKPVIGGYVVIP